MKIFNLLPVFSLLFFVACGDDSSSVISVEPESSSSSSDVVKSSSSKALDSSSSSKKSVRSSSSSEVVASSSSEKVSSSSVVKSSSSSVNVESSSSSVKSESSSSSSKKVSSSSEKVSSSSKKASSSSVAKSSSSSATPKSSSSSSVAVLTDPMEIFKPRVPKAAVYHCSVDEDRMGWAMEADFDQQDWICTFKYAGKEGFVYAQGSPIACRATMSMNPIISVDSAVLYVNGKYETLSTASYEWGGNHHNDKFRFTYDGKVYEYFHSSYGWGGRSCQEMDCMRVFESDGTTLIEDGCKTFDEDLGGVRSLPVVCRFASLDDGSFGDFTDSFEFCPGDSRLTDE